MSAAPKRPNILVIQVDEMTPNILPSYGNKIAKTPHLDDLAESGVVFESTYCNSPLCCPSRASMMSGQLAHNIEAWDNATELPASIPTVAHYMRDAGYYTALCGKMHFCGPDQVHGFHERLTTDIYPSSFAWTSDWEAGQHYRPTGITPRVIVDAGVSNRNMQIDYDDEVEQEGIRKIHDLGRYHRDKPFMLWMSFTHPHPPFLTQQKHWDLYDHDEIDMPKVPPIPVDELDTASRWLYYGHAQDMLDIDEEHVRNARHAYYGMASYVDDKVGRLCAALKEVELDDNTIIVFTADHGDMLGERGMWFKQCFFEDSVRVPLIFHFPEKFKPGRVSEHTSLIDLLPTFVDIATDGDAPDAPTPLDGRSLVGLIDGTDTGWDNTAISEYTGEGVLAPCRMIRRDDFKYIYTHGHPPLMYNTTEDPTEVNNLIGNPNYAEIEAELARDILDGWDPEDINTRCIKSQKDRLFVQATTQGTPTWAHVSRPGDDTRFVRTLGASDTKAKARYPYVEPSPLKPSA